MAIKFKALYPQQRLAILEDGSVVAFVVRQGAATDDTSEVDITLIDANVTDKRVKTKPAVNWGHDKSK